MPNHGIELVMFDNQTYHMALIDCTECGNQVSDKADSCPKCGSPILRAKPIGGRQCPFCKTALTAEAAVCHGCHAWYGYSYDGQPVEPKELLKGMRNFCLVGVACFIVAAFIPKGWFHTTLFFTGILLLLGALSATPRFLVLIKGRRWWRKF